MVIVDYPAIDKNVLIKQPALTEERFAKICDTITAYPESNFFIESPYPEVVVSLFPQKWQDPFRSDGGIPPNIALGVPVNNRRSLWAAAVLRKSRAKTLFLSLYNYDFDVEHLDEHLSAWRCLHCGRRGMGTRPTACPSGSICMGEKIGPQIEILFDKTPNRAKDYEHTRAIVSAFCLSHGIRCIRDVA